MKKAWINGTDKMKRILFCMILLFLTGCSQLNTEPIFLADDECFPIMHCVDYSCHHLGTENKSIVIINSTHMCYATISETVELIRTFFINPSEFCENYTKIQMPEIELDAMINSIIDKEMNK